FAGAGRDGGMRAVGADGREEFAAERDPLEAVRRTLFAAREHSQTLELRFFEHPRLEALTMTAVAIPTGC
ncbi:MAG TPA: hypothetical protein VJ255_10025, partial [Candidatus Acidoferrum sp.]|nr:hypothetical protein [Candidatus Acidoferrum sp.]